MHGSGIHGRKLFLFLFLCLFLCAVQKGDAVTSEFSQARLLPITGYGREYDSSVKIEVEAPSMRPGARCVYRTASEDGYFTQEVKLFPGLNRVTVTTSSGSEEVIIPFDVERPSLRVRMDCTGNDGTYMLHVNGMCRYDPGPDASGGYYESDEYWWMHGPPYLEAQTVCYPAAGAGLYRIFVTHFAEFSNPVALVTTVRVYVNEKLVFTGSNGDGKETWCVGTLVVHADGQVGGYAVDGIRRLDLAGQYELKEASTAGGFWASLEVTGLSGPGGGDPVYLEVGQAAQFTAAGVLRQFLMGNDQDVEIIERFASSDLPVGEIDALGVFVAKAPGHTQISCAGYAGSPIDVYVFKAGLVPDYDRDGDIDAVDMRVADTGKIFRFWINDDDDIGDTAETGGTDVPGQALPDCGDSDVNGRRDMLDFFPVWLDLKGTLDAFPAQLGLAFRLRSLGLRFVYTALTKDEAGKYLREECAVCGPAFNQNAHEAPTFAPDGGGTYVELSGAFINLIRADGNKGVLLVECFSPLASLELEIVDQYGAPIAERRLRLIASGVEDMYTRVNLRNGSATVWPGSDLPSANGKNVIFLHGFKVDEQEARAWNAEMFKRLWQSGSDARFHGVTWFGNDGINNGALNYHGNVVHAFEAAPHLRNYVYSLSGEKTVMAHSLGNMVVSSAIADHGMGVGKYFMLNAAVPAEAYDESSWHSDDSGLNPMMHNDWSGYAGCTWSARWHELFLNNPNDDRAALTWKNRFSAVPSSILYNFYSSGDEVLELNNVAPALLTGAGGLFNLFPTAERYAWHKQEVFKGRDMVVGTSWAGWGFLRTAPESTYAQTLIYPDAVAANAADLAQLANQPVFRWNPPGMLTNSIPSDLRKELLAKGVPALSGATGIMSVNIPYQSTDVRDIDMNSVSRPNGWPRLPTDAPYGQRWKHSDLKDMAFFYVYNVFRDVVVKGGLE